MCHTHLTHYVRHDVRPFMTFLPFNAPGQGDYINPLATTTCPCNQPLTPSELEVLAYFTVSWTSPFSPATWTPCPDHVCCMVSAQVYPCHLTSATSNGEVELIPLTPSPTSCSNALLTNSYMSALTNQNKWDRPEALHFPIRAWYIEVIPRDISFLVTSFAAYREEYTGKLLDMAATRKFICDAGAELYNRRMSSKIVAEVFSYSSSEAVTAATIDSAVRANIKAMKGCPEVKFLLQGAMREMRDLLGMLGRSSSLYTDLEKWEVVATLALEWLETETSLKGYENREVKKSRGEMEARGDDEVSINLSVLTGGAKVVGRGGKYAVDGGGKLRLVAV
jgi:hypothetical protein